MLTSDNSYQIFNFDNQKIRTHLENNKVYFCATDICNVLEYKNSRKAVDDHCKNDGVTIGYIIDSLGREQSATFISESNLYRLIFKSTMPKAVKFEAFIMEEVLPQIRKTGKYEVQKNEIQLPANYLQALEALVESEKEKLLLISENQQQQAIIQDFITIDENKNYTEVAKLLHKKPQQFINMLKNEKYIRLNREPYQKYIDSNHFVIKYKKGIKREEDGKCIEIEDKSFPAYLITPKGFEYFVKKLK